MKVFSLNYLRGKIDEKSNQVYITYIRPKCLHYDQIQNLRDRLSEWVKHTRLASAHFTKLEKLVNGYKIKI